LVTWSFRRLATLEDRRYIVIGALGLAALPLTHTTSTLIFFPLLMAYIVALLLLKGERKLTRGTLLANSGALGGVANHRNSSVASALILGLALSAFFTLPATLERQWIQIERGLIPPNLDYHHHFLSLAEVLSPPQPTDTGRMNPAVPRSLGLVQTIAAIAAIPGLRKKGESQRLHILFFALVLVASVAMMLPQSVALWDRLPPLAYLQFPFRWLGPASFAVAVLAGASVSALSRSGSLTSPRFLASAALLTLLVLAALPMLYPGYQHSLPANPSLTEMMDMERWMGAVGTTATGEYLPIWVEWVPPESLLEPMYRAGLPLKRLDTSTWPEGSIVLEEEYTPTTGQLTVQLTKMLKVFFDIHYFPGWRVYIDGEEVPIEPTQGQGRISFIAPAGEHVIRLQFEELPLRMAADAISVISLLVLLVIAVYLANHEPANHESAKTPPWHGLSARQAMTMVGLALLLLAVKVIYVDHHDTFFKWSFDGTHIKGVQNSLNSNFDDKITLLGYDLSSPTVRAGETVRLDLYWKAQRRLDTSYGVQARLVDSVLNVYAQQDNAHPGSYPTSWWEEGKYMKDTHRITIPEGTPPGQYLLQVGLYDPSTLQPLPVLSTAEEEARETVILQPLSVENNENSE
jgi:hypothetical protein